MSQGSYLLNGQDSELERLRLQSRVWEPAGRWLLEQIGNGAGARALDVGCGAMGWLRLLSEWVGPQGAVTGTDIDEKMLSAADAFVTSEGLGNVALIEDNLFASDLEPASFDLVHARFQLSPLGRGDEQMATYLRLVRPGGTIVLEDVDAGSLPHFLPPAPAIEERLIPLLMQAFDAAGGDHRAALKLPRRFRDVDIEPTVRAEVQALEPGHPYLRLPLQFAGALDGLLRTLVDADELAGLLDEAETELADPGRWGLTFTLVQSWGQRRA
ncbi:MAG: methyltransferase domain-containing protein [Actinomycetota bacterium]|nr:methyltransferase domain-containing protein [Actinomycetota bacterium]